MEQGSVENGTLADSQAQAAAIWRVREGVTEALQRRGGFQNSSTCAGRGVNGAIQLMGRLAGHVTNNMLIKGLLAPAQRNMSAAN